MVSGLVTTFHCIASDRWPSVWCINPEGSGLAEGLASTVAVFFQELPHRKNQLTLPKAVVEQAVVPPLASFDRGLCQANKHYQVANQQLLIADPEWSRHHATSGGSSPEIQSGPSTAASLRIVLQLPPEAQETGLSAHWIGGASQWPRSQTLAAAPGFDCHQGSSAQSFFYPVVKKPTPPAPAKSWPRRRWQSPG